MSKHPEALEYLFLENPHGPDRPIVLELTVRVTSDLMLEISGVRNGHTQVAITDDDSWPAPQYVLDSYNLIDWIKENAYQFTVNQQPKDFNPLQIPPPRQIYPK